ncbi:MAG: hypothetical protein DHS20C18_30410 [Saprospiraceae bacterium]|nr:MAG: hypothetical protein DHS20C18_30410 [Saprospiraceae bacterium]
MKKNVLLILGLLFLNLAVAQQRSNVRIGITGQFSHLMLTEPFVWTFGIEDSEPGEFGQFGFRADFQTSERWSIQTGMQYSRYHYTDKRIIVDRIITHTGTFQTFLPIDILPFHPEGRNRNMQTIGIPFLLQYHLDDLVPERIRLSVAAGLVGNVNLNSFSDGFDMFQSALSHVFLDGQIGPEVSFLTRSGQWNISPVFRMALLDYANKSENDGIPFETSVLKPYSVGLQVGYLWRL